MIVSTYNQSVHARLLAMKGISRIVPIVLLFSVAMAVAQTDVGSRLKSAQVPKVSKNQCAATPSQSYPCLLDVSLNGVRFSVIGYDPKTRRIRYLITSDEHFVTQDGLRVGAFVEIAEDKVLSIHGWHIYGPTTRDGWRTLIGTTLFEEKLHPADGSTVDPSKPIAGRVHRFKILSFEKGGV
jgi:hypothetical protein